ncbi:uncharacterized protein LOC124438266 isoform X3 [Xenia sp. Carnegie-2017]|uniref:uncharacterized protein LOC124438266 isoform X3 n=1 Tax=Xenia sp. Carnegie-2017 TaxID=2897299 RepID=UPI001F041290|nr:uncharacterized protein LOC124438266 isoform X3 [Xenia sp. Carnegie-2017]
MYTEISKLKRSCDDSEPETIADLSDEMFLETDDTIGIELSPCPSSSPCEPSTSLHIATNLPMNTPPIYNSQSASNYVSRSKELKCECPTCQQYFSIDEIAEHADICCDIWVGALQSQNTDSEKNIPEENPYVVINQDNTTNVKDKLLDIKAVTLSPKAVRLNVCRKNIWCDFIEYRSSGKVSPTDSVKIVFVGECAIDDGGPKREFFSEMLEHMERRLFYNGKPINSTVAIMNGDFRFAGEVMVMSLLQSGPASSFISPDVYKYITKQALTTEGMPDSKYKEAVKKIKQACDDEMLREILVSDDMIEMLSEAGYTGVPHKETVHTVSKIAQSICVMGHFSSVLPQIMQLLEGLSSCGLINYMIENPELWKPLFDPYNDSFKLSADTFLNEIIPTFSSSQIHKEKEVDVYKIFCDYVQTLDTEDY